MKLRSLPLALLLLFIAIPLSLAQIRDQETVEVIIKDVEMKPCLIRLGKQLDLEVAFDEAVKNSKKLNYSGKTTRLASVFQQILTQSALRACWTGEKLLTVYPDTEENRFAYSGYLQWEPERHE
jgi:hypothetical protein